MLDLSSDKEALSSINFPRLSSFLEGLIRRYYATDDYNFGISAEQLVDGMDIDVAWCQKHIDASRQKEYEFALQLVKSKRDRVPPMYPDWITCYIDSVRDGMRIQMIPGRDYERLSSRICDCPMH